MKRKLASGIFLLTAISVGLGAFGHGSQWSQHVLPTLVGLDASMIRLLGLVWYWVSGTMLVFGVQLLWTWWRIGKGERNLFFVPWSIVAFYLVEGFYAALYLGPFFLIFVVQAVLLGASAWALRNTIGTEEPEQASAEVRGT